MDKEFIFDDELFDKELEEDLEEQNFSSENIDTYLTENDFYSSSDDRVWESNVEDIDGGDNFADYCEYFFELLDEEEYYDN